MFFELSRDLNFERLTLSISSWGRLEDGLADRKAHEAPSDTEYSYIQEKVEVKFFKLLLELLRLLN